MALHFTFDLKEAFGIRKTDFRVSNKQLVEWLGTTEYEQIAMHTAYIMKKFAIGVYTNKHYQPAQDELAELFSLEYNELIRLPNNTNIPPRGYVKTILDALLQIDRHWQRGMRLKLKPDLIMLHDEIYGVVPRQFDKGVLQAAQELYEGVDVEGVGAVGLITYMRTDSLRISDEAKAAAAEYISTVYGKEYLPDKPRTFKTKSNAQDAHEAIRPSITEMTPARVKNSLSNDQFKLYKLIWERFIASQMANAQLNTVSVDIDANGCTFRATGYSVKFDGFMTLYVESTDGEESNKKMLPELKAEDKLKLKSIAGNQHFTQPPPRYTEASLIKALEENGIGRPSTYAPTITTITARQYVEHEGKQLKPTNLGEVITELMKDHFEKIVDAKFTAEMENDLDEVEHGHKNWVTTLHDFYDDFSATLQKAEEAMEGKRVKVPDEETDVVCELCGRNMVIKYGKYGKFLACPGFPECSNTKKIVTETEGSCPRCGKKMLLKKSKKGRSFYGCEGFPECNFMTWNVPTAEKCPECGKTLFTKGGKSGRLVCENEGCGYERELKK